MNRAIDVLALALLSPWGCVAGLDSYGACPGDWSFGLAGLPAIGLGAPEADAEVLQHFAVYLAVAELANSEPTVH